MGGRIREDYRNITGPEKSAILLMSLGEDQAAKLFSHLDDEEIKEISQVMAGLGNVSSNVVERLFVEFAEQVSSTGSLVGSMDSTQRMLTKILGEDRVDDIMEEIRGPAGRTMWDKLANVNEQVLANYLKNEYPQTVAVILGKIGQAHSAKVLAILPENFAMEVVMRMLRIEAVNKDIEKDVERVLRTEFMSNLARTNRRDSHETMAEIFTHLDRATESRFLSALEERNKDSSEKIRALMFTFEDLKGVDPSGVQTLLRNVDKDKLTVALKGASEELKDLFFSNMSERAAKLLREDMQATGPVRLSEVEEAQQAMIGTAKDLADRGEIVRVEARQHGDSGHQRPCVAGDLDGGGERRLHHRLAAAGVEVDDGDAQSGDSADRAGDRVRNIVELEVEKNRRAGLDDPRDAGRALCVEEFEAEFHAADMRAHRLRPGERALEIDGVEGDENGIVGQRGHAGISRKQGKG